MTKRSGFFSMITYLAASLWISGCNTCTSEYAGVDSFIVQGTIDGFSSQPDCGGTDGDCYGLGEVIVTYSDGTVEAWTQSLGELDDFYIRSNGNFDWSLHADSDVFSEGREIRSTRYLVELVGKTTGGGILRTGRCFEGAVASEEFLAPSADPFLLPEELDRCDIGERAALRVKADFFQSGDCPSR